jgi:CheY-like chemotaxis protein
LRARNLYLAHRWAFRTGNALLALAGFEVIGAASGFEALEKAPALGPDAVLLDVGLPDLSGYDVARRLRESPQFASTMLIELTGYDTPEARAVTPTSCASGPVHRNRGGEAIISETRIPDCALGCYQPCGHR